MGHGGCVLAYCDGIRLIDIATRYEDRARGAGSPWGTIANQRSTVLPRLCRANAVRAERALARRIWRATAGASSGSEGAEQRPASPPDQHTWPASVLQDGGAVWDWASTRGCEPPSRAPPRRCAAENSPRPSSPRRQAWRFQAGSYERAQVAAPQRRRLALRWGGGAGGARGQRAPTRGGALLGRRNPGLHRGRVGRRRLMLAKALVHRPRRLLCWKRGPAAGVRYELRQMLVA